MRQMDPSLHGFIPRVPPTLLDDLLSNTLDRITKLAQITLIINEYHCLLNKKAIDDYTFLIIYRCTFYLLSGRLHGAGERCVAIHNGLSAFTRPGNQLFEKVVDLLDKPKDGFERLKLREKLRR